MMRMPCLIAASALLVGCESTYTENREFVSTPLEFDPTEQIELAEWWSNDTQLLWLQPSGAYRLFDEQNPYTSPIERGRWGRKSYRALWLTEYEQHAGGPKQVRLDKTADGRLSLTINNLKPLVALERRPTVLEDQVIGAWTGDAGSLRLGGDLRYRFDPAAAGGARGDAPASIAGHDGAWFVRNGAIVLVPDSPSVDSIELTVERTDGKVEHLQTPNGELRRPARAAADSS